MFFQNQPSLEDIAKISPHLARLERIFSDDLPLIKKGAFDQIIKSADTALTETITKTRDDPNLMAAIRHYRGRINHLVAMTDFFDLVDVKQQMTWLTHAAEYALKNLAGHLTEDSGHDWFILALGKMGAGELNYSSDIDLIIITLHEQADYQKSKNFIALTRRLITIMSAPTKDGVGWRIDLRLRPDPGVTPIAMSIDAAMTYYESIARTWERAAFIRARPVAGNIEAGQQFLDDLAPFIWRRSLDYTVLEDLKIMLRREKRHKDLFGYNIKNGIGGIRSIEFFVHAQQLIAGGRESELRHRATNNALDALAKNSWISAEAAEQLKTAYLTWRRLEHRLQMIGDSQTHILPKSTQALADFAALCGVDELARFKQAIIALGDTVQQATAPLIERLEKGHPPPQPTLNLNWDSQQSEQNHETLKALGYENTETILLTAQGWLAGRISATRSPRARDLLSALLPELLVALAETDHPDFSFAAFARLVEKLPAGLQLFALMDTHQTISDTIINIVTSAPRLADIISTHPALADSLLYQSFWRPEDEWPVREQELMDILEQAADYEENLLILRRYCREWQFRTSMQLLQSQITPRRAGRDFSTIADIIIRGALNAVSRNIKTRFGTIEKSGMIILALGRLGAEEMTLISDLDLIFIYDGQQDSQSTGGAKSIAIGQYYTRFGQELINALSALTSEGRCYDIDMRLRPSGNKGPVAMHQTSFLTYQESEAWSWEHMALIKSRIIGHFGNSPKILEERIPHFIKRDRAPEQLIEDVATMRARLKAAFPSPSCLNLRASDGGIMDLDLLVQMLQMMPQSRTLPIYPRPRDAARPLADAGLITKNEAAAIRQAGKIYNDALQLMRLLDMRPDDKKALSDRLPTLLRKHFGINDLGEFSSLIEKAGAPISAMIRKYVESKKH